MRAAVTGSTGLVGSHLVEALLEQGYEVRALARKTSDIGHLKATGADIVIGDVEDYDSLKPLVQGADIVFHAAAKVMPGWGKWEEFESCIVKGTENMLNAGVEAGVSRFLYFSSEDVYGENLFGDTPADESTPAEVELTPYTYYCYAKLLADRLGHHRKAVRGVRPPRPAAHRPLLQSGQIADSHMARQIQPQDHAGLCHGRGRMRHTGGHQRQGGR